MAGPNYQNAFAELVKGINLNAIKKGLGNEAKDLFEKIAAEFAKNDKGAYVNNDVKLRAYRVAFEREIGMRNDFVKKSNELFEADLKLQKTKFKAGKGRVPYYRPGHISSADDLIARTKRAEAWLADKRRSKFAREGAQRAARDRRLQELSPDDSAAIQSYKNKYGAGWRNVALKEYRDLMMSIRSPEQYERLQAIRQWGTDLPVREAQDIEYGRRLKAATAHTSAEKREVRIDAYASSMGRRNAEKLVDAEDDERRRASRAERRKEQLSGYFAYKRDMFMSGLDEREQFAYAHAKQYGGGKKGRDRAREVWEKNLLDEFKWLKPLSKNSKLINKNLPFIAKNMKILAKIPIVGQFVKNPATSAAAVGIYAVQSAISGIQSNAKTAFGIERSGVNAATGMSANHVLSRFGERGGSDVLDFVRNFKSKMGAMRHGGGTEFLGDLARYGIDPRGKTAFQVLADVTQRIHDFESHGRSDEAIALADQFNIGQEVFAAIHSGHYGKNFLKFINSETGYYKQKANSSTKSMGTWIERTKLYWGRAFDQFGPDAVELFESIFTLGGLLGSNTGSIGVDKLGEAARSASSLSEAEMAAIDSGSMIASLTGDTFHIENVNVNNPKDAMEIVNQLKSLGSGRTLTASLETLASMDTAII